MSHDQNFKNLILDYPEQALALFAAEEAAGIGDGARITPLRQEQLQERLGERFRELDVPLLVEWPDGRREALLFVIEEESAARRFNIHRLAHYCLDLAELCETDRVVPVVIFLDGGDAPERLMLGGDHVYLDFRYLSCHLRRLPYHRYRDSDNLVARLNLPNMAWSTVDEKLDAYAAAVRGLLALEPDADRRLKYVDFIDIYGALDENERKQYQRKYPREEEQMKGFAERFREEGLKEGMGFAERFREEGLKLGVRSGEAAVVARLMEMKFCELSAEHRRRIEKADAETLLRWSERILTADRPEAVFGDD